MAAGLGAKWFVVTGPDNPFQPLHNIGVLTTTNQVRPLISAGGGVKVALRLGASCIARGRAAIA